MMTGLSYSVSGLHRAVNLLNQGARKVNRDKIVEGYLDMNRAVRSAQANLTAVKTQDKLIKAALDIYG